MQAVFQAEKPGKSVDDRLLIGGGRGGRDRDFCANEGAVVVEVAVACVAEHAPDGGLQRDGVLVGRPFAAHVGGDVRGLLGLSCSKQRFGTGEEDRQEGSALYSAPMTG